jgi:hypothetical protein
MLAIALFLISAVAWAAAEPDETVHSVSGFTQSNLSSPFVQVRSQSATGYFYPVTQFLHLNPIGNFSFDPGVDTLRDFFVEPYPYGGPYAHQVWATFGWWEMFDRPASVWGEVASGDSNGFKMPTAGHATYCGFWDGFVVNPKTSTVTAMGQNMTIQTTFQHSGTGLATINTFDVQGVGATTSGGIGIANDGIANFNFRTYAANGQSLTGGYAKAMLEFYGPNAIQLSATFSGPWRGTSLISGGLLANRCG